MKRRLLLLLLMVVGVSVISVSIGPKIKKEIEIRIAMNKEVHPIWRDLSAGRIEAGDRLATLIQNHLPTVREDLGRFTYLTYFEGSKTVGIPFTGLSVTAKDGELVWADAWSCTWEKTFFDVTTKRDKEELEELWAAKYSVAADVLE